MRNELTQEQVQDRFLNLVRDAARTWAGSDLPDDLARCEGIVSTVLGIFDGKSEGLPALDIVVHPHPSDRAYCIENGENYYPQGLVINDDCTLQELWKNRPADELILPDTEPRAFTKTEVRNQFLDLMRDYARYWAAVPNRASADRCNGLGFSLLNIFDGTSASLPALDIVTRPQEGALDHHDAQTGDYVPSGMVLNDDGLLHDKYYAS
jgi:hypothetical protein